MKLLKFPKIQTQKKSDNLLEISGIDVNFYER